MTEDGLPASSSGSETSKRYSPIFGLAAFGLFAAGMVALFISTGGNPTIRDMGVLFAGGCLGSSWIAFEHWRTGELINV